MAFEATAVRCAGCGERVVTVEDKRRSCVRMLPGSSHLLLPFCFRSYIGTGTSRLVPLVVNPAVPRVSSA